MRLRLLMAGAAALCLAGWAAAHFGGRRWANGSADVQAGLAAHQRAVSPALFNAQELFGLPAPVRRYFEAVLTDGQPMVAAATLHQTGSLNMREAGEAWKPFTAVQRIVTHQAGFVWDARVMMAPGLAVLVHDAYVAGVGLLKASVLGLYELADTAPSAALSEGELMRFLAEAVWYPTALLPSQGVVWAAVDDQSATATLQDSGHRVTLLFRFQAGGLVSSVHADARGRLVDGVASTSPWEGRFWDAQKRGGMVVPMAGEVAWLLPSGTHNYWRGRITHLNYEFQP
jgi:hypothetical protein